MNKVMLLGRLVRDPELIYAAGTGTAVSKFTIAVNRKKKDEKADFISCVAFGKTAETIAQYFIKGRQIAIAGRIQTSDYEGQDGKKKYKTDIVIETFDFIGSNSSQNNTFQNDGMEEVDEDGPF